MPETLGSGSEMLSFVKTIKPAARNRGIICHAGSSGIYLRDVVISPKAKWKDFGGYAHAVVGAYRRPRPGNETSANPPLSIFHWEKRRHLIMPIGTFLPHGRAKPFRKWKRRINEVMPTSEAAFGR